MGQGCKGGSKGESGNGRIYLQHTMRDLRTRQEAGQCALDRSQWEGERDRYV